MKEVQLEVLPVVAVAGLPGSLRPGCVCGSLGHGQGTRLQTCPWVRSAHALGLRQSCQVGPADRQPLGRMQLIVSVSQDSFPAPPEAGGYPSVQGPRRHWRRASPPPPMIARAAQRNEDKHHLTFRPTRRDFY